jgi:transposase
MKQSVISGLHQNILNLSKSRKKGNRVGRLKFISHYDSIDLKQFGVTYRINGNRIRVQGIKQTFRVRGLEQLNGCEMANAKFIQKAGDFYFHVTAYRNKPVDRKMENTVVAKKRDIGIDFGISHQMTIADGREGIFIDYQIGFPKRLKKLYRGLSRKKKHSSCWYRQLVLIQKEFGYLTNCKDDVKNKLCNILDSNFRHVCYQNDNFRGWQRIWGRRMMATGIGGITARLKKSATSVQVDRFFPSTKKCSRCRNKQDMALDERIYLCKSCSHEVPRDKNSADNILFEGLDKIGVEYTEYTPSEIEPLHSFLVKLNAIPRVNASLVVDVGSHDDLSHGNSLFQKSTP